MSFCLNIPGPNKTIFKEHVLFLSEGIAVGITGVHSCCVEKLKCQKSNTTPKTKEMPMIYTLRVLQHF